jgi:hypothetical protein
MKWALGIILFVWLLSGAAGAAMQGDLNRHNWKAIVRGPITLAKAYRDNPVQVPGAPN